MYALYLNIIEDAIYPMIAGSETKPNHKLGSLYYILLYIGGIYASLFSGYIFKNKDNPNYLSLGASGTINPLVFSFILFAPTAQLGFFFIPMPAWVFDLFKLFI